MSDTISIPHVGDVKVETLQHLFEVLFREVKTYDELSEFVGRMLPVLHDESPTMNRDLAKYLFEIEERGKAVEGTCQKAAFLILYQFFRKGTVLDRSKSR